MCYNAVMHIKRPSWNSKNGRTYQSVWLCRSQRVGKKTKTDYVLNLKDWPEEEIEALEFALKQGKNVHDLVSLNGLELIQGKSVGAVWAAREAARKLGVEQALGEGFQAQLALWQILARLLEQGSRLSAVRLHQTHALAEVLQIKRGFDEDDLYENLAWLSHYQHRIEDTLYHARKDTLATDLLLYDVTSSYLEGDQNALGAYGYNRDGKRGKKQIVVGLLCDVQGEPISVQVYQGNTSDVKTFGDQVRKTVNRFGCQRVTFVGDRGMIKTAQRDELREAGFQYITGLTKPQINTLLADDTITMELFDEKVCEVQAHGQRYLLRRNPVRAKGCAASRADKLQRLTVLVIQENDYLKEHLRADVDIALKRVTEKAGKLKVNAWVAITTTGRTLALEVNESAHEQAAKLDGCYVLITDCSAQEMDAQTAHARYKDLAQVEQAFRISKTGHLELRPIYVRNEDSTRGHVFVVMLAYLIRREMARAWRKIDCTVEEGLESLGMLCYHDLKTENGTIVNSVPKPGVLNRKLFKALKIAEPPPIPKMDSLNVGTHKKLPKARK
jgi:transposase